MVFNYTTNVYLFSLYLFDVHVFFSRVKNARKAVIWLSRECVQSLEIRHVQALFTRYTDYYLVSVSHVASLHL